MRSSLRITIGLIALTGLVVGFGFFGWLAVTAIQHEGDDLLKERLTVAYVAASYMDNTLNSVNALLDTAVDFESGLPSEQQFVTAERLIRDALGSYGVTPLDVAVVDETGRVVRDIPEQPEMLGGVGYQAEAYPAVKRALEDRTYAVSEVVYDPLTQRPAVLLVSPIFGADKMLAGAVIAEIDIQQLHLFFLSSSNLPGHFPNVDGRGSSLGTTGYVEIVDSNGTVIDRTPPGPPVDRNERTDRSDDFVTLINEHRSTIAIYAGPEHAPAQPYVLAFVPLATSRWGIAIWQSKSEVLDASTHLRNQFVVYGALFLALALAVEWVGLRRLIDPILLLASASRKVGEGNFDIRLPIAGNDEIGQLAEAFRSMTSQLQQARDTLSELYQSEKKKDELRGRLLRDIVVAQEDERKRIARELHDELAQSVTALIMSLEFLETHAAADRAATKGDLANARKMATQLLDDIRNLTLTLRPMDLDVLGLVPAIRTFIESRPRGSRAQIHFSVSGLDRRLAGPLETALFRVAQELIRNVDKHASATNVQVKLERTPDAIRLTVEDDGKGFDMKGAADGGNETRAFGLVGIRERVEMFGGETTVESALGKGTRVTVIIPLPSNEDDQV